VSRIGVDERSDELIGTIVLMSDNLALDLVAVGIETRSQRDRLVELGCELGQGHLLFAPARAERPEAWVATEEGPLS
jgi:EAL domain-containing protein (putative c-di-GMP-specific phosphodiesterase class I)